MLTLLFTGLLVGLMSSFFGIGGGAIIVPALYFLYPNIPPQTIISSSLGVIFFNGIINTIHFWKLKKIPNFRLVIPLALAMAVGAQIGGHLALQLPALLLKRIFAGILLIIALKLSFSRPHNNSSTEGKQLKITFKKTLGTLLTGLAAGLTAGLTGVGGGIIIVPTLLVLYKLPFTWLSPYSNPAMSISALSGIITFLLVDVQNDIPLPELFQPYQWGYLNFALVALLVATSWPTSRLGARLTTKIDQKKAQRAFAFLLYIISLRLFFS